MISKPASNPISVTPIHSPEPLPLVVRVQAVHCVEGGGPALGAPLVVGWVVVRVRWFQREVCARGVVPKVFRWWYAGL